MKRCILFGISVILLLGLVACASAQENTAPDVTVPKSTSPEPTIPTEPSTPVVPDEPAKKEEMVTISMLTKANNTSYHKNEYYITVSETVESVLEYDDNYCLTDVKMYYEDVLVYEYVYDKDPDRLLVAQYIDSEGNTYPDHEYSYNENGDRLTSFYYDLPGEDTKIYYSYDDSGKLQKEIWHSYLYDWDGEYSSEQITETIYTYDADGKILSEDTYEAGKKTRTICYSYDDSGKLLEVRDSSDYYWQIRTYDSYGNCVAVTNGYHDPSRKAETTHYQNTYENGKLLESTGYENGVLCSYEKYDPAGNLILDIYYLCWIEVDGEPYRNEYEYDENGRLIRHFSSELDNGGQRHEYTFVYTYDENGWLTSKKTYYFDELSAEYIPIYETVTVTSEQAESIEKANQKYYYLPEPNC